MTKKTNDMFSDKERIQKVVKKSNEDQLEIINKAKAMKKTNLEIIKKVIPMGFTTIMGNKTFGGKLLSIVAKDEFGLAYLLEDGQWRDEEALNKMRITGFLPVGHLFGEPVIPEGQKFKIKGTGQILRYFVNKDRGEHLPKLNPDEIECIDNEGYTDIYSPSQLEPVFE